MSDKLWRSKTPAEILRDVRRVFIVHKRNAHRANDCGRVRRELAAIKKRQHSDKLAYAELLRELAKV